MKKNKLLEVKELKTHFNTRKGLVKAVDGISFTVNRNEIMALVGESGCGKSVTSRTIMGLIGYKKNEIISGKIFYKGKNLLEKSKEEMRQIRGNEISIIFQDPMTSLNPLYTVGTQIAEVPIIHEKENKKSAWKRAVDMLKKVGIPSASSRAKQYPHQFSGGMSQRGVIGMSLVCQPDLLIADEPTTALDVTIQSQILNLLVDLKDDFNSGIMLITHNLGVVAEVCDKVAVMYAGRLMERAGVSELFNNPSHPYTKGLLASLPVPGKSKRLTPIKGQPPDLHDLPRGCRFFHRCPEAFGRCKKEAPPMFEVGDGHYSACWLEGDAVEKR
ncbi:MAG: ABC transporter ATP-binding protein [Halanaerobiales bacterium]